MDGRWCPDLRNFHTNLATHGANGAFVIGMRPRRCADRRFLQTDAQVLDRGAEGSRPVRMRAAVCSQPGRGWVAVGSRSGRSRVAAGSRSGRARVALGSQSGRSRVAVGSQSGRSRVAVGSRRVRLRADAAGFVASRCLSRTCRPALGAGRGARGVRRYFPTPQKFQAAGPPHAPDGGRPISFSPHGNKPRAPPCTRPGACASVRRRIDRHARCCLRAPRRAMRGHGDRACFRRSIDTSPMAASRRASTPAPGAAKRAAPRRPTDTERES
ncbi:hypothetical protein X978_5991 [Burkholderia pseudomallei MSHR3965]|nr:hypothetical protein X978_5991 [Burkholderia pseudomallei MSHR3965]